MKIILLIFLLLGAAVLSIAIWFISGTLFVIRKVSNLEKILINTEKSLELVSKSISDRENNSKQNNNKINNQIADLQKPPVGNSENNSQNNFN